MIYKAQEISHSNFLNADLCIIGAGAAGLALCDALVKSGMSIILLDSGDFGDDQQSRGFIAGSNAANSSFNLNGQRRRIGGGMSEWSGNCSLLQRCPQN